MQKSKTRRKLHKCQIKSQSDEMIDQMKNHPAWKGDGTLSEMQELLSGHQPYTIAISQGMNKHHFFLSYVNSDNEVKHRSIKILRVHGKWAFKNCALRLFYPCVTESDPKGSLPISELIAYSLKCSSDVCRALV